MFFDQVVGGLAHGANAGQTHRVARAISTLVSTPSLGSPMKIQVTNVQVSEFVRVLMSAFFLFFWTFRQKLKDETTRSSSERTQGFGEFPIFVFLNPTKKNT